MRAPWPATGRRKATESIERRAKRFHHITSSMCKFWVVEKAVSWPITVGTLLISYLRSLYRLGASASALQRMLEASQACFWHAPPGRLLVPLRTFCRFTARKMPFILENPKSPR